MERRNNNRSGSRGRAGGRGGFGGSRGRGFGGRGRDSRGGGRFGGSNRGGFSGGGFNRPREMHKAKCAKCGEECEVPFKPTEGRPVYCRDCFNKKREKEDQY